MKRSLVCCGDSTNIKTWSNIPYFVLKAGIKEGLLTNGLKLKPELLRKKRIFWNIQQLIKTGKAGGFQYSLIFNKELLNQSNLNKNSRQSILSHFPALPSYPWPEKWDVAFYIDATTKQIFDDYEIGDGISKVFQEEIIKRERQAYNEAYAIICMSKWAAESVINDYKIAHKKVHIVPGGANLEEEDLKQIKLEIPPKPTIINPLRIGFLGKDWERKGGPFLIKVIENLNNIGLPSVIRAIGPDKKELPQNKYLQSIGFINKQTNTLLFASEISSWHFGTLFSSAEAFGISNRECMRLGTPVLTSNVGGISSTFPYEFCGKLFKSNPNVNEVSNWIYKQIMSYDNYIEKRIILKNHWHEFTWAASVKNLKSILM